MAKVCLDTQIIIWGIKETATEGQEEMVPRAKRLIEHMSERGDTIFVPAVVLAEILSATDPQDYPMIVNLMGRFFEIQPFDLTGAQHFARLWRERRQQVRQFAEDQGIQATREELKADCLIVATAIASGADIIYSHDSLVSAFANGEIPVEEIPDLPEQADWLHDADEADDHGDAINQDDPEPAND